MACNGWIVGQDHLYLQYGRDGSDT